MAKINNALTKSGFEIVKKRIGEILTDELQNQKTLQGFDFPVNVFVDRINNFDVSEIVIINVRLENLNKSNQNQYSSHDEVTYNIDIIATGVQTNDDLGGTISTSVRDSFASMCINILQSNIYATLGFEKGLVMSSNIESFNTYEAANNQDSNFVSMGRVSLAVKIYEGHEVWAGENFESNFTDIKLGLTDLGYKFVFNN